MVASALLKQPLAPLEQQANFLLVLVLWKQVAAQATASVAVSCCWMMTVYPSTSFCHCWTTSRASSPLYSRNME
jgi:hypothetical protein